MTTPSRTPIVLPELGAAEEPIRVSTWLVDLEDVVEPGERVVDVIIPGVSFSVAAPAKGRLVKIELPPDAPVRPGDVLGWLEASAENFTAE